jgi:predicted kinase
MLYIFSGLPAVGKTTLAKRLAMHLKATYIRVDTIEDALKHSTLKIHPAEDTGYTASCALACENLELGNTVIADSVNPIPLTRKWWQHAAIAANKPFTNIEIRCSDTVIHQARTLARNGAPDAWQKVIDREYHPWDENVIRLDTARTTVDHSFTKLLDKLSLNSK